MPVRVQDSHEKRADRHAHHIGEHDPGEAHTQVQVFVFLLREKLDASECDKELFREDDSKNGKDQGEKKENAEGVGYETPPVGLRIILPGAGIDRHNECGESAFAQDAAREVWNLERDIEAVGKVPCSKPRCDHRIPDQSQDPRQERDAAHHSRCLEKRLFFRHWVSLYERSSLFLT